jgi:protein-disulfide isomerase
MRMKKLTALSAAAGLAVALAFTMGSPANAANNYPVPRDADSTGITVGQSNAPVTVDVWIDYGSPASKDPMINLAGTLQAAVDSRTAKVIYHPMNFLDRFFTDHYSTRAASAAGCASDAGVFTAFTAQLFAHQPDEEGTGMSDEKMIRLGAEAGATSPEFGACVKSLKYVDWTTQLTQTALVQEIVKGVPTMSVNGTQLAYPLTVEELTAAIQKATSHG